MKQLETDHAEMVKALAKSGQAIVDSMTAFDAHILHMAVGVVGEVAELVVAENKENVVEEIGDIEFYVVGLREELGISRDTVLDEIGRLGLCSINPIISIVSYAGDLIDIVKKKVIYRKSLDIIKVTHSMAGLESTLKTIRFHNGISREETLVHNIAKLGERYKEGYSDQAAQDRSDKIGDNEEDEL